MKFTSLAAVRWGKTLNMDRDDFEGTLVLEKMAEIDKVDAFLDAVDADDFAQAKKLMWRAGVDLQTIQIVLQKMAEADGEP